MSFTLRPALPTDAPILTSIYLDAFSSDEVSLTCFPRNPNTTLWWETNLRTELSDPNAHFVTILDTATSTIVAFAKWNAPRSNIQTSSTSSAPSTTLAEPHSLDFPAEGDTVFAKFFFGSLDECRARIMGERRYWYLELVATRKEFQGKGCAGSLIRYGLEKADREGVECYLEASPEGAPIYEYFGFKEIDRLVVFDGKFIELFMVREGQGKV